MKTTNSKSNQQKEKPAQDSGWPFPSPGGPTAPSKRSYNKKVKENSSGLSIEEYGEALL